MSSPVIQFDPTPRPVRWYAELWAKDGKTLDRWCREGRVPGAFRGPDGAWWVRPVDLIEWDPRVAEEPRRPARRALPSIPERLLHPGAKGVEG